jgi:hypothetical protein
MPEMIHKPVFVFAASRERATSAGAVYIAEVGPLLVGGSNTCLALHCIDYSNFSCYVPLMQRR